MRVKAWRAMWMAALAAAPAIAKPVGNACAVAVSRSAPTTADLPVACRSVGPIWLGMTPKEVVAALGKPDFVDAASSGFGYIFPRDLKTRLAARPVASDALGHGELSLAFAHGRVTAMSARVSRGGQLPFRVFPLGRPAERLASWFGPPRRWSGSHDEAAYDPLPIAFMIDDGDHSVFGISVADKLSDIGREPQLALRLIKRRGTDLVSGFTAVSGS